MSIVDSKKKIFGKIAANKTLTEGLPKLKLGSSFSSVNNGGDITGFLTDLIKSLVGFEALVEVVVNVLTHSLPKIEKAIKQALKVELKTIVSCGVDPHLPAWMKSTGTGINIEVKKIDFLDILRTDPNSVAGRLLYTDIVSPLTNSTDFNTFLYGVIQDDGNTNNWKNIVDITFNSLGTGTIPNNTITVKANQAYDNKTLTDLNNDFVDSLTLFNTPTGSANILSRIMDILFGSIASTTGKSLKQLESEASINNIVEKMANNINVGAIDDSAFSFTKEETYVHQVEALNRRKGASPVETTNTIMSSVPMDDLIDMDIEISGATSTVQKKAIITTNLDKMAASSTKKIPNPTDVASAKLNFVQQIIMALGKAIVGMVMSPKIILIFIVNFKIVYGQFATFTNGVDFMKKNKNLMHKIIKTIVEELIKILLKIALKEIGKLVASAMVKKQKEKGMLKLSQLQSLVGIPTSIIKKILDNL